MEQSKLDKLAKQIVPSGFRLEKDRSINAKVVLDPNNPAHFKKWKKAPNKTDLEGFDTKDRKEPSIKRMLKSTSAGYIESDPERFVAENYETRRLIDSVADKITDKKSMIEEITRIWKQDDSLKSFWYRQNWLTEGDWEALFKTKHIQRIIKNNTIEPTLKAIQEEFGVDRTKAITLYEKLPAEKRNDIFQSIKNKFIQKISKTESKPIKIDSIYDKLPKARQQKSKGGKVYQRTKPQIWTQMQEKFLLNNSNQNVNDLIKVYNTTFSTKRTKNSLQNKIYRLKKKL